MSSVLLLRTFDQRRRLILKRVAVDDVDDWDGDVVCVCVNSGKQRFKPFYVHFTMAVQKHQHLKQSGRRCVPNRPLLTENVLSVLACLKLLRAVLIEPSFGTRTKTYRACRMVRSNDSRSNQTFSLCGANEFDFREMLCDVVLQLILQMSCGTKKTEL